MDLGGSTLNGAKPLFKVQKVSPNSVAKKSSAQWPTLNFGKISAQPVVSGFDGQDVAVGGTLSVMDAADYSHLAMDH